MSNQKAVKTDIDRYSKLEAVALSEGGQLLIKSLRSDILSSIDELCIKYRTAHGIELRAVCARLDERLKLLRVLTRSEKNKKLAREELNRLIEEEGVEEE